MTDNVSPILAANQAAALDHLIALFGRAMEGKIEITAIKATTPDERASPRTRFFSLDQIDMAAEWAIEVNREPQWNAYVGAALRRESVFPGSAADDTDFLRTYAVWADADNAEQVAQAKAAYDAASLQPTLIVVTGRTPERRAQFWWPLETPIGDIEVLRATVRGIADALGTDHGVLTGKQLMRVAGTLAWPKPNKPGRVLELVELVRPSRAAREVTLEQVHRAFPPAERPGPKPRDADGEPERPGSLLGALAARDLRSALTALRSDDRELWVRMGHALRELGDAGRALWLEWSQTSDKYDAADAARVWDSLRGERTGYQAVFAEAQRQGWVNPGAGGTREPETAKSRTDAPEDPDDCFEVLSISDLKALPDAQWIIKDAVPAEGLIFIYGPPASFKSFVCADLALSYAYGAPEWLGYERRTEGAVLYIASEGAQGIKNRITAWQRTTGVVEDTDHFHLIRKTINFLSPDDRGRLVRTVARHIERHGPVSLIFVDTVSRVLPGADENLQKDMTVFVGACDALRDFGASVVGVHHTNKNGEMRGSTVFAGQGDAIFRIERDEGSKSGVLTCEKLKDADDGWKRTFATEKVEWTPAGKIEAASSLVVTWGGEPGAEEAQSAWPPRDVLWDLQRALSEAFQKGAPLSMAPQTRRDGRHAPSRLATMFDIKAATVEHVLQTWLDNGVIEPREVDSHSKLRGLQVVKWLD
jgi:hypothetical protein